MAIYNKNGVALDSAYRLDGESLTSSYDINGNEVFSNARTHLKIMTYNVGQWYIGDGNRVPTTKKTEYFNLQDGTFSTYRPDVLFMQEYLNTWCQDGSASSQLLSSYFDNQQSTNDTSAYKGHSICTNGIPIASYTSHNFSSNKGNYPTFESAEIVVGGKTVTIINTHNDYVLSYQQTEVTDLLSFLSNLDSFVLCGDFNINLSTEDTTDDQYLNSVKRFLDAGYHVGNCVVDWIPTYYGTASPEGGKFTDQIVTSADIRIDNIYADTTKLTDGLNDKIDHLPLIAEISFLSEEALP